MEDPVDWNELKIVRLYAIQTSITLFAAASPEDLETHFNYQIDVSAVSAFEPLQMLPGLFEQIKENNLGGYVDCRYGLIGISKKGVRLFSIYLDRLTDRGFSDKKAIIAPPALKDWIKKWFPAPCGLTAGKWGK